MSVQLYNILLTVFNFIQLLLVPNLLFQIIVHSFDFSYDPIYAEVLFNSILTRFVQFLELKISVTISETGKAYTLNSFVNLSWDGLSHEEK